MRVAIIGSRDYQWVFGGGVEDTYQLARSSKSPYARGRPCPDGAPYIQDAVRKLGPEDFVVTGGATGADYWGEHYARLEYVSRIVHEANWQKHGSSAGPIRNKLIISDVDVVLAFYSDKSKSRGTVQAVSLANQRGLPVFEFDALTEDRPSWYDSWYQTR